MNYAENFTDADDPEDPDIFFSPLDLMKRKIKNDDAKKILRLVDDSISKIEIITYMECLKDRVMDMEFSDEERHCINIFRDMKNRANTDYRSFHENKQNAFDCYAFLNLASELNWKLESIPVLINGLRDLCCCLRTFEMIIVEKFSKTPAASKEEQKVLKDLKNQDDELSKVIDILQKDLQNSENTKRELEEICNHITEELQLEINRIEWLATDKMDSNVKQANKAIKETEQEGQGIVVKLNQHVTEAKSALDECMHNNLDEEVTLRRNRRQTQEEIAELIQKYDIEMGDRQSRYDYLYKEYMDELEKEKMLSVQVVELKKVYDVIMEEMQKKEAERERLEAELAKKTAAATVIQKNWRSYIMRKILKGGDKKDKGKKSGKKGKKK